MSDLRALIESGLIDKEDGTIFDTTTNLLWQQVPIDKRLTLQEAVDYCKSLTLAGHNDWRLSTIEELKTLINKKYNPIIDPIFKCRLSYYWSSSTCVDDPNGAWIAHFDDLPLCYGNKTFTCYVRAVRGKYNV